MPLAIRETSPLQSHITHSSLPLFSPAPAPHSTPSAHRLCHLLLLCCSLAGCPGADGLTQAAATRCARLLLAAPTSWALDVAKDHAANAAQALHAELVRRSLRAVPAGVARLAAPGNAADRGASRSVELLRAWLSSLTSAGLAHEQADCAMDEVCLAVLAKPGTGDEGSESETAALFVPAATQAAMYAAAARVAPLLAPPNALYLALVLGRAARAASRSLRAGPFLAATSVLFRHACGPGRDGASARALLGGSGCPYSRGDLFGIVLARLETQDVEALGTLCHAVLTLEAEGARTVGPSGDTGHNQTSHTPLLNHLAFNPGHQTLLSTLWRHLAHSVPLPLEAHRASSRGWDVPSLARGARASLTWGQARCWGVLCRLLRHLLGALDDAEFAAGADGLSPEGRRALTAALNTMVVRTLLPAPGGAARQGTVEAAAGGNVDPYAMLLEQGPWLHRCQWVSVCVGVGGWAWETCSRCAAVSPEGFPRWHTCLSRWHSVPAGCCLRLARMVWGRQGSCCSHTRTLRDLRSFTRLPSYNPTQGAVRARRPLRLLPRLPLAGAVPEQPGRGRGPGLAVHAACAVGAAGGRARPARGGPGACGDARGGPGLPAGRRASVRALRGPRHRTAGPHRRRPGQVGNCVSVEAGVAALGDGGVLGMLRVAAQPPCVGCLSAAVNERGMCT